MTKFFTSNAFFFFINVSPMMMGYGQQIYAEAGFSTASFKGFQNELRGQTLENDFSRTAKSGLGIGILFDYCKQVTWLDLGLQYNNYMIRTSVKTSDTTLPLVYDFSFFSLKAGVRYKLVDFPKIKIKIHGHVSHGWLSQGTREYSNNIENLLEDDYFYKNLLSYHFGSNIEFDIVEDIGIYLSQDIKNSLRKNNPVDESYRIKTVSFNVGLLFKLGNDK